MTKITCKIVFRLYGNSTKYRIIGDLEEDQLSSKGNNFITIETKSFTNNTINTYKTFISKADIIKIIVLEKKQNIFIDKISCESVFQNFEFN